jgi:hypothetical protein
MDFYDDGVIIDGNIFSVVRTHNDSIVDMTGGQIETYLEMYDTSTFNAYGGILSSSGFDIVLFDSTVANFYNIQTSPLARLDVIDDGTINIYGYNFNYVGATLYGNWSNGNSFRFYIRTENTFNHLILYEIPEPMSIFFFGLTGLLIVKKRF